MGWDLIAYLNIDQDEVSAFIKENNINNMDWEESKKIVEHFTDKKDYRPYYNYNDNTDMHEICFSHHSSFIRDDERFENTRYQNMLEKKIGKPFPWCLNSINSYVRTKEEALEVAAELKTFFADDNSLLSFADWLEDTAQFCDTYELSW